MAKSREKWKHLRDLHLRAPDLHGLFIGNKSVINLKLSEDFIKLKYFWIWMT